MCIWSSRTTLKNRYFSFLNIWISLLNEKLINFILSLHSKSILVKKILNLTQFISLLRMFYMSGHVINSYTFCLFLDTLSTRVTFRDISENPSSHLAAFSYIEFFFKVLILNLKKEVTKITKMNSYWAKMSIWPFSTKFLLKMWHYRSDFSKNSLFYSNSASNFF